MGVIKPIVILPADIQSVALQPLMDALQEISAWVAAKTGGYKLNIPSTGFLRSIKSLEFFLNDYWSASMWAVANEAGGHPWDEGLIYLLFVTGDPGTGTGAAVGGLERPGRTGVAVVTGKALLDLVEFPVESPTTRLHPRGVIAHELFHALGIEDPTPDEPYNLMEHNTPPWGWEQWPEAQLNASQIDYLQRSIFTSPSPMPGRIILPVMDGMTAPLTPTGQAELDQLRADNAVLKFSLDKIKDRLRRIQDISQEK